ncbi:DUF1351 domain-containing protein [Breznakia sp. OttesenSCG-928-G09]|nr:DUF1351 domain-containing protein [Breznakia sp. OttesenSCG-928-G09]
MKNIENAVTLKQAPVIEYSVIDSIGEEVDKQLAFLDKDLVVTEDNKKEIKKLRAELKKSRTKLDDARKVIKKAVNDPYLEFENLLKSKALAKYDEADAKLKAKIDEIENAQKANIEKAVREHFEQIAAENNIDFVSFDELGINITLSSKTLELQNYCDTYINRIVSDLEIIDKQENKERILVKYKSCVTLDNALSYAINDVANEIEQENALKEKAQMEKKSDHQKEEAIKNEPVKKNAVDKSEDNQIHKMTFTVTGTMQQLKRVKEYLIAEGVKYE